MAFSSLIIYIIFQAVGFAIGHHLGSQDLAVTIGVGILIGNLLSNLFDDLLEGWFDTETFKSLTKLFGFEDEDKPSKK